VTTRRRGTSLSAGAVVLRAVAREVCAPLGDGERYNRCTLRESSMSYEDRGPELRCPLAPRGLDRGTIQQTKAGRPNPAVAADA
jgi:hypothetical protein